MNDATEQRAPAQSPTLPSNQHSSMQAGSAATDQPSQASPPPPQRFCSHCKTEPVRRPGQRYCKRCHAASCKFYRRRNKEERIALKAAFQQPTLDAIVTREKFESRFGVTRFVQLTGMKTLPVRAEVMSFMQDEQLEVRVIETGELLNVSLHQVERDLGPQSVAAVELI